MGLGGKENKIKRRFKQELNVVSSNAEGQVHSVKTEAGQTSGGSSRAAPTNNIIFLKGTTVC